MQLLHARGTPMGARGHGSHSLQAASDPHPGVTGIQLEETAPARGHWQGSATMAAPSSTLSLSQPGRLGHGATARVWGRRGRSHQRLPPSEDPAEPAPAQQPQNLPEKQRRGWSLLLLPNDLGNQI